MSGETHIERKHNGRRAAIKLLQELAQSVGWRYVAFVAATLGFGLITLLPPEFFRFFTEHAGALSTMDAASFLRDLAIFGTAIALALLISSVASTISHEWLRLRLESELRRRVLARLHEVPLGTLDGAQRGDWLTRMTGDLGSVEMFLTESLPTQIRQLAVLLGAGTLFFIHGGLIAVLPLASAIALAAIHLLVQRRLAPVLAELRGLHGGVFQLLIESLEGIRTIRSHGGEPFVRRRFEAKLVEITTKSMSVVRSMGLLLGGSELAGQLLVTACLTLVTWSLTRGGLTLQEALFYPFFIGMFYGAAEGLAHSAYDWNRFFVEGGRVAELLHGSSYTSEARLLNYSFNEETFAATSRLEVRDLAIGHGERMLATGIDLDLAIGRMQAIMGPSGCGKSSFLEVLAGLRPAREGRIALKNDLATLWQSADGAPWLPIGPCAYVEQRPYIFEGSLRENLTFGNPQRLSDARIWECLERVGLYAYARRNGGLEHRLADCGRNLSEGERYRIALCRALLLKRPFLLLDEPFAALDEASIRIVMSALEHARQTTGILLVTHYVPDGLETDGVTDFNIFHPDGVVPFGMLGLGVVSPPRLPAGGLAPIN